MPARPSHRRRETAAEEIESGLCNSGARPVKDEKGAEAKVLEIEKQVPVEGDAAGDGEGGERGAVEQRQALQLLYRQREQAPALDLPDETLEFPPARFPPLAKLAGA